MTWRPACRALFGGGESIARILHSGLTKSMAVAAKKRSVSIRIPVSSYFLSHSGGDFGPSATGGTSRQSQRNNHVRTGS